MKKSNQVHRVNVVYRAEKGETEGTEESINFGSRESALIFRDRQAKLPNVVKATYINME